MNYQFPPELAEKVRRRMDSGRYLFEKELFDAALDARDDQERQVEEIRQKLAAGVKQLDEGLGVPLDLDAFLDRVNAKYQSASL